MKKTILFLIIPISFIYVSFTSCNFLDVDDDFNETLKYDSIFDSKRNFERYIWGTANAFPDEGAIFGNNYTPGPMATDEAFCLFGEAEFRGMAFNQGLVTPTNLYGMSIWGGMYTIIRKANTMLSKVNDVVDMTASDKADALGYIHFMRGYAYYHLLMQYGPVPLLGDAVLENNESSEHYNFERATYNETADYVCAELEIAANYLPVNVPIAVFGRPAKYAAYGLIARTRLQQASPAFNGKEASRKYFGDWTRSSDGTHYVSQQYDEEKWAIAAANSKRIIDTELFRLYTVDKKMDTPALPNSVSKENFPNGAGNIDPFRSYSDMFTGEALAQRNDEYLWGRMSGSVRNYTKHSFVVGDMGGWNGMSVTQKVIDAYRMIDGQDIHESSAEYPYTEEGFMGGADKSFSNYILKSSVSNMYVNREMRFYASIGFSECFWTASSTSESARKNKVVTYYRTGNGGRGSSLGNSNDYPITGYVLRKYIHEDDAWAGTGSSVVGKSFPIIRYAEILLSYVEAINNLTTTHHIALDEETQYDLYRNVDEIKFYFNQIRFRAGLPGITDAEAASPNKVQELLERERMTEFLYENRRYYDVRRWGIYEETEREPVMGMDTDSEKDNYYNRVLLNHPTARKRIVDKKLMFMPISLDELRKVSKLDQNPGWPN